jgi:hypothetical protein
MRPHLHRLDAERPPQNAPFSEGRGYRFLAIDEEKEMPVNNSDIRGIAIGYRSRDPHPIILPIKYHLSGDVCPDQDPVEFKPRGQHLCADDLVVLVGPGSQPEQVVRLLRQIASHITRKGLYTGKKSGFVKFSSDRTRQNQVEEQPKHQERVWQL